MQTRKNKKHESKILPDISKNIWHVLSRNQKGSGLFFSGLFLCLIGIGISLSKQLSLSSDPHETSIALTLVVLLGLGLPLILTGINFTLRSRKLHVYVISIGFLISMISLVFFGKYYPERWYYPTVTWVSTLYISGIVLLTLATFANALEVISRSPAEEVPFLKLREILDNVIDVSGNVNSQLRIFRDELENWVAASWKREKESKDKYYGMADSLFLLLDHLENIAKDEKRSDEIDWVYEKTIRILEDEGIEEIPVKRGDIFNGMYHEHVGHRLDELVPGTILEVTRKGYFIKDRRTAENDVILRAAEVIVSSGPSEKQPESKISEEG